MVFSHSPSKIRGTRVECPTQTLYLHRFSKYDAVWTGSFSSFHGGIYKKTQIIINTTLRTQILQLPYLFHCSPLLLCRDVCFIRGLDSAFTQSVWLYGRQRSALRSSSFPWVGVHAFLFIWLLLKLGFRSPYLKNMLAVPSFGCQTRATWNEHRCYESTGRF